MENNEKKSNGLLIGLVVFLIIAVLGLGGYIIYDKVIDKDEPKVEENEKLESTKISINSDLVQELKKYIPYGFVENMDGTAYSSKKIMYKDLSNKLVLETVLLNLKNDLNNICNPEFEEQFRKMYGSDNSYTNEQSGTYIYQNGCYIFAGGGSSAGAPHKLSEVYDAEKSNDELYIYENYIYLTLNTKTDDTSFVSIYKYGDSTGKIEEVKFDDLTDSVDYMNDNTLLNKYK